jgi:predicted nucleic acid-binding protein
MKCIVDVNVLLPLLCEGHSFQASAYAWYDRRELDSVGWCLPVRLAILRHLSNERIMGSGVLRPEESLDAWEQLALDERLFEVSAIPPSLEDCLRSNVVGRQASPKLWTDAWLAALAETLGYEMVTYDRGFRKFSLTSLRLLGEED